MHVAPNRACSVQSALLLEFCSVLGKTEKLIERAKNTIFYKKKSFVYYAQKWRLTETESGTVF